MLGGNLTQSALTASFMAELGHTGDMQILDDREFGYARFIGTRRWLPEEITTNLGTGSSSPCSWHTNPTRIAGFCMRCWNR